MSAGGLSYSGLRTYAKATLPSVEMWGTNLNILKDPPKSIHTRRIDKVGQTQSILNAQDESGDRIAEAINVYARGVNPMVAVSFDNYSNNAGRSSPFQNKANASLPYKVRTFRPPVQRQEDLLPLSRLPRNWFYSYTNPSFPGVVQAAQCNEVGRSVHETITHPQASTNPSLPASNQTYLSSEYSGKSVSEDKRGVVAITNKSSSSSASSCAANNFERLSAGKVGEAILMDVSTQRSLPGVAAQTSSISKDPKQVHRNKRVYEAFSQRSVDRATGMVLEKTDTSKQVRADPLRGDATTNRSTREHFVQMDADTSTIPTKDYLYSSVKTKATAVFRKPATTPDNNPKALLEEPLRVCVAGTKRLRGGAQATDGASTSAIPTKPFLYHSAEAPRSSFVVRDSQEGSGVVTHSVQEEPLLASAASTRSFITSKRAFDDSATYEIHNAKRTPLHSVQTNTQTPYAMYLEPGVVAEQKRSRPLMEAGTAKDNAAMLEASRDAYQVQSRNGSKKTQPMLPKGGFEGQGSAVPVFNQYEHYNYAIDDPVRQDLRQRTASIMEGRHDTAPVFS